MRRTSEKGEGKLGTLIFFALLAAIGLALWNVIPVIYDHYDFTDAVEEICRTPRYKARDQRAIKDMLNKEVLNRRLEKWITPDSFQVSEGARNRTIFVKYDRPVKILPGWNHTFKFEYTAEQPLL